MCLTNHTVCQCTLREFGKEINVYNRECRILRCQQKTEEHFCERGLFDNYVENELNLQLETPFYQIYKTPGGLDKLVNEYALFTRKFAFVCFLRTKTKLLDGKKELRQKLLEQALEPGYFPYEIRCEDTELLETMNRIQQFFVEADMEIVRATDQERFILSDAWPVVNNYDNPTFATLVLGPDASVFFYKGKMDKDPVGYSNYMNLIQCGKELTFRNVKDMVRGVERFMQRGKDLDDYGPLFEKVMEVYEDELLEKLSPHQRSVLKMLSPPRKVVDLIFEDWDLFRLTELTQSRNIYNLTALVVFHRFGLAMRLQLFDWHHIFSSFSDEDLRLFVQTFSDDGDTEFAKCQAAVCTEILALRGDDESQEKMGRLYKKGKHVPEDKFLSFSYYASAAKNGNADAIGQMLIHYLGKGDLATATQYFELRKTDVPMLFYHLGRYKIENENLEEGIGLMERSAVGGYEGAYTYLFKLVRKCPLDYPLKRAECLVFGAIATCSNGVMHLVRLYEELAPTKPEFEEKLEDLICMMEKRGFREVEELRKRHPAKH